MPTGAQTLSLCWCKTMGRMQGSRRSGARRQGVMCTGCSVDRARLPAAGIVLLTFLLHPLHPHRHPLSCVSIHSLYSLDNCRCFQIVLPRGAPKLLPTFDLIFKNYSQGLPWWHSGWESACQCRGQGFEPWSGRIPHAVEQLGPWATATEPARLEPVLRNKRARDNERPLHRDEEWPPLATTRESPRTETKTQHSQK